MILCFSHLNIKRNLDQSPILWKILLLISTGKYRLQWKLSNCRHHWGTTTLAYLSLLINKGVFLFHKIVYGIIIFYFDINSKYKTRQRP